MIKLKKEQKILITLQWKGFHLRKNFHYSPQMNLEKIAKDLLGAKIDFFISEIEAYLVNLERSIGNFKILFINESNFPKNLLLISNPPLALFIKGNIDLLKRNFKLTIIGTRNPSFFSLLWLDWFIKRLPEYTVTISGFARGIDQAVHTNSNKNGTIAVLPHSLDYGKNPLFNLKRNCPDYLFITEYLHTDCIHKYYYVHRNRILAGIGDKILIAEAGEKSGAMITAAYAKAFGKEIWGLQHWLQKNNKGVKTLLHHGEALDILPFFKLYVKKISGNEFLKSDFKDYFYLGDGYLLKFEDNYFFQEFPSPVERDRDFER